MLLAKPLDLALQHESIPYPLSERSDVGLIVPIQALHRVKGETRITPDDATKTAIQKAHITRVIGSYQLCLDATGHPLDLRILKPTGVPGYDERIIGAMQHWVYEPYLDEGKAIPVCAAVTFIYSQR